MGRTEKTKILRDPVYGYIEIEENIVHNIIDTSTFQRLRNIRQTSYAPLYPSALHNRFVHSLGVYHLGCLAFDAVSESIESNAEKKIKILGELCDLCGEMLDRYKELFKLACLLHDVGHAPFSHTGEEFYMTSKSRACILPDSEYTIYKHLTYLTQDAIFDAEVAKDAASHEIMSCIIALESFGQNKQYFKDDDERSFFARCITGLLYDEATNLKRADYMNMHDERRDKVRIKMLQNCIIKLLHSDVIDVDRLDYIIRDASTMGYQSVSVDYKRLLSGLELVMEDDYNFTMGFHKNAISVIENAVYAHDNEKKWVQSHPVILYDSFLLHESIKYIEDKIKLDYPDSQATLFSYDSLTSQGSCFEGKEKEAGQLHIRYLSDADLIFLMKNQYSCSYSEEYFSRNTRRHPVWKSEAEFIDLFDESERTVINEALEIIMTGKSEDSVELTSDTIEKIKRDIVDSRQAGHSGSVEVFEKKLVYVRELLDFCTRFQIKESIVLLRKSFFKSNFSKNKMQKLPIYFPGSEKKNKLKDVSPTLSSEQVGDGKLVYMFYYPPEDEKKIDTRQFSQEMLEMFKIIKKRDSTNLGY